MDRNSEALELWSNGAYIQTLLFGVVCRLEELCYRSKFTHTLREVTDRSQIPEIRKEGRRTAYNGIGESREKPEPPTVGGSGTQVNISLPDESRGKGKGNVSI